MYGKSNIETRTSKPATKRLNIKLPESVYDDLVRLADQSGRSMTDVIRIALGLAKIALEETRAHRRLAVVSEDGNMLKEIVIAN